MSGSQERAFVCSRERLDGRVKRGHGDGSLWLADMSGKQTRATWEDCNWNLQALCREANSTRPA